MLPRRLALIAGLALLPALAQAQTQWDLPAAYGPSNVHTENLLQSASDMTKATGHAADGLPFLADSYGQALVDAFNR